MTAVWKRKFNYQKYCCHCAGSYLIKGVWVVRLLQISHTKYNTNFFSCYQGLQVANRRQRLQSSSLLFCGSQGCWGVMPRGVVLVMLSQRCVQEALRGSKRTCIQMVASKNLSGLQITPCSSLTPPRSKLIACSLLKRVLKCGMRVFFAHHLGQYAPGVQAMRHNDSIGESKGPLDSGVVFIRVAAWSDGFLQLWLKDCQTPGARAQWS